MSIKSYLATRENCLSPKKRTLDGLYSTEMFHSILWGLIASVPVHCILVTSLHNYDVIYNTVLGFECLRFNYIKGVHSLTNYKINRKHQKHQIID